MYEEQNMQMVNLLLDAIDSQALNENTISKFSYWYMYALLDVTSRMKNGKELYLNIKSYLEQINIDRLRRKQKIVVGFIANYASSWIGDELYYLLERTKRFEPYLFLISNHNVEDEELIKKEYSENLEYFKKTKMRIIQTYDLDTGRQYTWEEIGIKPDFCIWLTSWIDLFKEQYYFLNYSLDTLHAYIPYGFMIAENKEENFVGEQYNKLIHNIVWRNFEESSIALEMAEKYSFVGKKNAVYTGYPKMDAFFKRQVGHDAWKMVLNKAQNLKAKKIVYAPHHTMQNDDTIVFSTFASNYKMILEIAEKFQRDTVWIFKPHPHLKYKAIRSGLFADINEWDAYEQRWRMLINGDIMQEGSYEDLFRDSDAMITDSVSFLAEYLYVHKPLLQLSRKEQKFNDFGKRLMEIHYTADGADRLEIEEFIREVVIMENDINREKRDKFFEENLDYVSMKRKSAAENICEEIEEIFK